MGKKSHAPEYSSATVNSDIFGNATADKKGVTLNATPWETNLSNVVTGYLPKTVNQMQSTLGNILSGDYLNDANFKAYKNNFNRQAADTYDTAVLGNLADRGLMRSSGMQALTNNYANAMRNDLTNLMDNYYNRQVSNYNLQNSNLASLLNTQNALYDWLMGVGQLAQSQANAVSGYNQRNYQIQNSGSGSNIGSIVGGLGSLAQGAGSIMGSMKS